MTSALLSASAVSVRYGATTALDGVDLDVRARRGARAGRRERRRQVDAAARARRCASARRRAACALAAGTRVAWVPQEAVLPADLDAAAWIFLGHELRGPLGCCASARCAPRRPARAARGRLSRRARARASAISPPASASRCSSPARCATRPTCCCSTSRRRCSAPPTRRGCSTAVRRVGARRRGVVYVSHRLDEVLALADRVTVLRDGRRVATDAAGDVDADDLVRAMVGRDMPARRRRPPQCPRSAPRRCCACATCRRARPRRLLRCAPARSSASPVWSVAGRSAVLEGIAGSAAAATRRDRVRRAAGARAGGSPAQRAGADTVAAREPVPARADAGGCARRGTARDGEWIERPGDPQPTAARRRSTRCPAAISRSCCWRARCATRRALLLLDEPTAGVDVGAKAEIHAPISRARRTPAPRSLLASSDLPELLALCDRIAVLYARPMRRRSSPWPRRRKSRSRH